MSAATRAPQTATARRAYADALRAEAGLTSSAIVEAFATVPREWFVGPGPWQILDEGWGGYHLTPDTDPE
ncbi:MAG TPA: protein-L-isoaspartate O-methyltransferase, partial [Vineibacter sp.]|nr:protein-L-isoaspartate O-methyltransferase [Vineibacter sp.]